MSFSDMKMLRLRQQQKLGMFLSDILGRD